MTWRAIMTGWIVAAVLFTAVEAQIQAGDAGPEPGGKADSGSLVTCLAAAADVSPVYPTATFPAAVREVVAVFRLGEGERFEKLTGRWIAVDVGDVAPPNYEIASTDLPLLGRDRGSFRFSLPRDFPVGSYRIEVLADGRAWKTVEFRAVPNLPPVALQTPDELYPLAVGRSGRYTFVMEPGPGLKINLPGIAPDREGKLRAEVTMTAVGGDDTGTHLELRRNDRLVFQEWMRWSDEGLVATRRQPLDEAFDLDPPQPILRRPFGYQKWDYESKDKEIRAAFRMWGPIPVQGPRETTPGFVVLAEIPPDADGTEVTAERHFVAGLGMVREIDITARDGHRITRQEIVLKAH